jgi:hypothetical protein
MCSPVRMANDTSTGTRKVSGNVAQAFDGIRQFRGELGKNGHPLLKEGVGHLPYAGITANGVLEEFDVGIHEVEFGTIT